MANILIVDDSPTMRKIVLYALKPTEHKTYEAGDGIEALEKLAKNPVDLMVVDLNMPRMDGLELVRQIRAQDMYKQMPIIMLTTEASDETKKQGYQAGVDTYLVKPTPHHLLLYKIEFLLEN
jgi:two-component system chemotaxis response regulator CheY